MKALKDKRVQLSIVGLIVAAAAAYGVAVDEQALLAVVALLAAVAGGLAGRVAGAVEVRELESARALRIFDELAESGARVHNQAINEPFIYPDSLAQPEQIYNLVKMAEDVAILSGRVAALEQQIERLQTDS